VLNQLAGVPIGCSQSKFGEADGERLRVGSLRSLSISAQSGKSLQSIKSAHSEQSDEIGQKMVSEGGCGVAQPEEAEQIRRRSRGPACPVGKGRRSGVGRWERERLALNLAPDHRTWASSSTRTRRNGSTSVTKPIVWKVPRSASLVTVAGLMSTQTTLTRAGNRLPTAME